jgi:hypothetical protein
MSLSSFHGKQDTKDFYINRVARHIELDHLVRGIGWEDKDGKIRGCGVGCTLENYDHSQYPIELGIPEWLARVEDTLFEGMSLEKSRNWPKDFLEAIPLGVDLEQVKPKFLIMVLESTLPTFDHEKYPNVKKCLDRSIALWKRDDIGSEAFNKEAADAAEAARAAAAVRAADAAAWAAEAAVRAADAADAAAWAAVRAAEAAAAVRAADAADAAAWAADAAAWAAEAARAAKYDYFADELLKMLRECK